jgi:phage-related protein
MPSSSQFGWTQRVVVELLAPDPTWYDPTQNVQYFALSGGADTMEVPTEIPMTVGASSINASETFTNNGDVATYPTIRINGPITGPKIVNNTTGDELDFAGTTIGAGEYFDIDCRYGYKTVEDQDGTNQISTLSDDSDIATFSLEADPTAENGNNSITVTGTGCTEASSLTIRFYERYIGV